MFRWRVRYLNVVALSSLASVGFVLLWQHPAFQEPDISQHGYLQNTRYRLQSHGHQKKALTIDDADQQKGDAPQPLQDIEKQKKSSHYAQVAHAMQPPQEDLKFLPNVQRQEIGNIQPPKTQPEVNQYVQVQQQQGAGSLSYKQVYDQPQRQSQMKDMPPQQRQLQGQVQLQQVQGVMQLPRGQPEDTKLSNVPQQGNTNNLPQKPPQNNGMPQSLKQQSQHPSQQQSTNQINGGKNISERKQSQIFHQGLVFNAIAADRFLDQLRQSESTDSNNIYVAKRFPWVVRNNFLPNFYTKGRVTQGINKSNYSQSSVVFVHNQKSGGSTLKLCMENIAKEFHFRNMAVVCDINSGDYYTRMSKMGRHDLVKFHSGGHSFQTCNYAKNPCAYVTVLRDPYERLISSYEYCKVRNELHCQIYDANQVSVTQWAVFQGSFFFRQLLYNFEFCKQQSDNVIETLRLRKGMTEQPADIPCWYRNELILSQIMNKVDKMKVLRYVLDHLEDWFAVIGIIDEYNKFLSMLEGAFQLPFSQCQDSVLNYHPYDAEGEGGGKERQSIVNSLKQQLINDPEVQEALYFDLKIFEEARKIFARQKEAYGSS
ncbi:uncharacterized protein [Ptychodera flava]|uniref:uncharacterized protein n=1 Tax=Ptychodera flava TaxID=63121 RepID=UPI00396A23BE